MLNHHQPASRQGGQFISGSGKKSGRHVVNLHSNVKQLTGATTAATTVCSMAVSSLKGCWYKFSARVRDYLDVVDSYYRPPQNEGGDSHHHHHHHHHHQCQQQQQPLQQQQVSDRRRLIRSTRAKEGGCGKRASAGQTPISPHSMMIGCGGKHHHHHHHHPKHSLDCELSVDDIMNQHHRHQQQRAKQQTTSTTTTPSSNNNRSQVTAYFSKRKTSQGQVYFVDAQGRKYWYDPSVPKELLCASLDLDSLVGSLSTSWEIRQTSSGKTYYVNHNKRTTQFTDPRLVAYKDELMRILKSTRECATASSSATTTRPTTTTATGNTNQHSTNSNYYSTLNLSSTANNNNNNNTSTTVTTTTNTTTTAPVPTNPSRTQSPNQQTPANGSGSNSPINSSPVVGDFSQNHATAITNTHHQHQHQPTTRANRELFDKISILRQELLKQQVIAHPCRIDINRKRIFEESFRIITQMQPRDLKKRLLVKFRGEEGLDYGGVAREWFYLLSREILNPVHGLFQYTSDDIYNLQINPESGVIYREHLSYMNFCGRIIGMAVFHGHFIEGHFTLPFYKMLLKKSITLSDIELVDPELHRSLCWILENDITNVIDTTFLVQHNAFGQLQEHELKENGRNLVVTEENKHEYVSLYVNYRCRRGISSQFEALQRGFHELISPYLVENFDEHELELLIGGLSKINIEDWRLHTKLKNCTVESPLVKWFWDIVKSYSEDKRARLLQFVTGSPRVPIQGFKALQGVNSELRLFTIHLIKNACTDNLPKSHTCFNRIDLPPYESYERLRDKLTQAIEETMGFAMQ